MNENLNRDSSSSDINDDFSFDINPNKVTMKKDKRPKTVCIIAVIIAAAVILAAAAVGMLNSSSPEKTVAKAVRGTIDGLFKDDSSSVFEILASQASESDFSISYKGSAYLDEYAGTYSSLIKNSGLTAKVLFDPDKQEAGGSIDASVAGMGVNIGEFYADSSSVSGRLPIIEETWVKIGLENIFSNYNNSALSEHIGKAEYNEDFSINPFELVNMLLSASAGAQKELLYNYLSSDREVFNNLKENMTAEKTGEVYTTEDGKKAEGYNIVLQGTDISNVIMDLGEYVKEQSTDAELIKQLLPLININGDSFTAGDIESEINASCDEAFTALAEAFQDDEYSFTAYIYKNRFVKTENSFKTEGINIIVTALLPYGSENGDKTRLEVNAVDENSDDTADFIFEISDSSEGTNTSMSLNMEPYSITLNSDYSKDTTEYALSFNYNNSYYAGQNISLTSKGTYEKSDDSFSLSADDISITDAGGNVFLSLGMSLDAAPLSQTIEKPAEDGTVNLFTTDENEYAALRDEIKNGAGSLYSMLGQFF